MRFPASATGTNGRILSPPSGPLRFSPPPASGKQQDLLLELHGALTEGRIWLDDRDESRTMWEKLIPKDYFVLKAFTDNIVLAFPIHRDAESEFGSAFFKIAAFQLAMATKGFFIRGAVSIGNAYVDDFMVFGDALTQAYQGERRLARDPRIILTEPAVMAVKSHLTYYSSSRYAPQTKELLCDADGQWFINYLDTILMAADDHGPFYDELKKHKAAVEEKLSHFKSEPPIFSKYAWIANYHNFFCDLHSDYFSDEYKIDTELFRSPPKLIVD
jgi:hypothetical protein